MNIATFLKYVWPYFIIMHESFALYISIKRTTSFDLALLLLTSRMCRDVFRLLSIIYGRSYCGNSSRLSEYIVYMSIWCAMWLLTHLFPMHPFSPPWKHKKTAVSWCLQGAEKGSIGNKWVNFATTLHDRCLKRP